MTKAKPKAAKTINPLDVACPKCKAGPGESCQLMPSDRRLGAYHRDRRKAAKGKDESKWTAVAGEIGIYYRKVMRRGREVTQYRGRHAHRETAIKSSKGDARHALAALLVQAKEPPKPEPPPIPKGETLTFAELADEYERAKIKPTVYDNPDSDNRTKIGGIAAKSVQDAKRTLAMFKIDPRFKDKLAKDITKQDVTSWKEDRFSVPKQRGGGRRSVTNVNHELRVLRNLFTYAMDQYGFAKNPVRGLIDQGKENVRDRYLLFSEIKALIAAADESLRPLLIFMLATAARVGEAIQVERRDIDLDAGIVTLRRPITKSKKRSRELPITRELRKVLAHRLADMSQDPNALLFDKSYDAYETAKEKTLALAGLEDVHLHDLRRTWITYAIPSGISLPDAMKISDHYNEKTFLRYFQQTHESHRVNAERLNTFWQQGIKSTTQPQPRMLTAVN
jgi:integrase